VTQAGYALLGLTAITAMLVGMLTFALLRIVAGARDARRNLRESSADSLMLSAALQEAVAKLKEQEQAMSARAAASDHLRFQIADSLTAGLLVVDGDGRVEVLNPAGRRLLEMPGEPIGIRYEEALSPAPSLVAVIAESIETGEPIVRRSVEMSPTMNATHLGVTVSPLTTAAGMRGAICLFSDLTNVVELEEQLRVKETLARLGELTAGIAHEFRNGLATIHGYSRLLDPRAVPAQFSPYIEGIRQETEALDRVVTNFLNFARPEQLLLASVDLARIARRAADDIQHELPAGTTVSVTGEFAEIQGDEVLLRQVFSNLLRNAAEACESVGRAPAITVEGRIDLAHRTCRVWVEDNGPGIPAGEREKVFRPFFTSRSRGTGLGLAIVQKIVLTHQGRVSVGTARTGGAAIELTFRLAA
jgi:nitrogen fixation/metabolism regulation signal transduction histidine kinase